MKQILSGALTIKYFLFLVGGGGRGVIFVLEKVGLTFSTFYSISTHPIDTVSMPKYSVK